MSDPLPRTDALPVDEREHPDPSMQAEIDQLLNPAYVEDERQRHLHVLQRVLVGLEAIEVAETPEERMAALEALPDETGEDEELDLLLAQLKKSTMWMSDLGMTVRMTIARAQYVQRLVQPTRMVRKLPVLYGHRPGENGHRPIDKRRPASPPPEPDPT